MVELAHKSPGIGTGLPLESRRRPVVIQYFEDVLHNHIRGTSRIAMIPPTKPSGPAHTRTADTRAAGPRLVVYPTPDFNFHPHVSLFVCAPPCPAIVSSPKTLLAAMNLSPQKSARSSHPHLQEQKTHSPPCQAPKPRTDSACTLVMRSRFSRSARLAESCASWAWRCDCAWLACVARVFGRREMYELTRFDAAGSGGEPGGVGTWDACGHGCDGLWEVRLWLWGLRWLRGGGRVVRE